MSEGIGLAVEAIPNIQTILVPQGWEYRAVCRGVARAVGRSPRQGLSRVPDVLPIPMGPTPVTQRLEEWLECHQWEQSPTLSPEPFQGTATPSGVVVLGLCGGLGPQYRVGQGVVYAGCVQMGGPNRDEPEYRPCDRPLTDWLVRTLSFQNSPVTALTSDRLIWASVEKRRLGEHQDVVDMEGYAILRTLQLNTLQLNTLQLNTLQQRAIAVGMVRVVSDDCYQDLPDLSVALDEMGQLQIGPLAIALLRRPQGAWGLIQGSLRGLRTLSDIAEAIVRAQNRGNVQNPSRQ